MSHSYKEANILPVNDILIEKSKAGVSYVKTQWGVYTKNEDSAISEASAKENWEALICKIF